MIRKNANASHAKKEIRGCIDLGSSYFRLLVVEGAFPELDRLERGAFEIHSCKEDRRYIGWGEDLVARGLVSKKSSRRALVLLGELIEAARGWGCEKPILVGTNTLREASNAAETVSMLERAAGEPIRVLSQREEAAMGFAGAALFQDRDERISLIDVGGTSSEISWGRGAAMEGFCGVAIGVHPVRAILGGAPGTRRDAVRLARELGRPGGIVCAAGGKVYPLPGGVEQSTILMTGGTAVSLAIVLRYMRGGEPVFREMQPVTLDDLAFMRRKLSRLVRSGREETIPLDAERTRLLPAGSVLIEALLLALGIGSFRATARDLRWGVLLTSRVGRKAIRAGKADLDGSGTAGKRAGMIRGKAQGGS